MKRTRSSIAIRRGSVTTRVYRIRRKDGREVYTASWNVDGRRITRQFSTYPAAHAEASLKADQMASGRMDAAKAVTAEDGLTLQEARRICGEIPILSALDEWSKARGLCKGSILPAAESWAQQRVGKFKSVCLGDAVKWFIAAKTRSGHEGKLTYQAKLKPLITKFGAHTKLDDLNARQLTDYLNGFADGVTRNDMRKRAVTLWRWARMSGFLPENAALEIEKTVRAKEKPTEIGILSAAMYQEMLEFIRSKHPEHLAALVFAGFCGIRSDEIHGKRADRSKRQLWEDVHIDRGFVRVTVAKTNTPAWRYAPLCSAAIEWLLLCPNRKGPVCVPGAMERVRLLLREAKFTPPENAFRHSFITYRTVVTGSKPQVALEAGNSVGEIDRRYRVPVTKNEGEAWFAVSPTVGAP